MDELKQYLFHILVICGIHFLQEIPRIIATDNYALMSGSLRTFQVHACDDDELRIQCFPHTGISVNFAQYGRSSGQPNLCPPIESKHRYVHRESNSTACSSRNVIKIIEGMCQKELICRFITSPRTFWEDPCPGMRKYVEVAYKCRPAEFVNKVACEGEKLSIVCSPPLRILIYSAIFGSTYTEIPECPQKNGIQREDCQSGYATNTVMTVCLGKERCTLFANEQNFGNPGCLSATRKYLKVVYTCVPKEVLNLPKFKEAAEKSESFTKDIEVHTTSYPAWASNVDKGIPSYLKPHVSQKPSTNLKVEMQRDDVPWTDSNSTDPHDRELVNFMAEWISAHKFMKGNTQKLILYVSVSLAVGVILFVLVVFLHFYLLTAFPNGKEKLEVPVITDDDFFSDSDLEHFEGEEPFSVMNSLPRKISETIPRAPVTDGPSTNHYFS